MTQSVRVTNARIVHACRYAPDRARNYAGLITIAVEKREDDPPATVSRTYFFYSEAHDGLFSDTALKLVNTVGVESWDGLEGSLVRVAVDHSNQILAIGHIFKDMWVVADGDDLERLTGKRWNVVDLRLKTWTSADLRLPSLEISWGSWGPQSQFNGVIRKVEVWYERRERGDEIDPSLEIDPQRTTAEPQMSDRPRRKKSSGR